MASKLIISISYTQMLVVKIVSNIGRANYVLFFRNIMQCNVIDCRN